MQVVSQEVSTGVASMTIENTKECTLRPVIAFLVWRLHYIQNYRYSIFIIVSDDALVSISRVPTNDAIFSYRALSLFEVR